MVEVLLFKSNEDNFVHFSKLGDKYKISIY